MDDNLVGSGILEAYSMLLTNTYLAYTFVISKARVRAVLVERGARSLHSRLVLRQSLF